MIAGVMAGCGSSQQDVTGNQSADSAAENGNEAAGETGDAAGNRGAENAPNSSLGTTSEPQGFNETLIRFIEEDGYADKNYLISPTSYRAALALAVAGAGTETKQQLLAAMDFENEEELEAWYASLQQSVDDFNEYLQEDCYDLEIYEEDFGEEYKKPDGAFKINNSIWSNSKFEAPFSQDYIDYVSEHFGATARNVSPEEITDAVNAWANENTDGLIPCIADDLSDTEMVLANALYLRSGWNNSFSKSKTEKGIFTGFDGSQAYKQFMQQKDDFRYYEDDDCKFIVLGMAGGIRAVFILGDSNGVIDKIPEAEVQMVDVKLPKFETETSFSRGELMDYLSYCGADLATSDIADFSAMCEQKMKIADIIQKARIKVDEEGMEAAAVTMLEIKTVAAPQNTKPEPYKTFHADEPFKYMILSGYENPEMLFYGQIVQ